MGAGAAVVGPEAARLLGAPASSAAEVVASPTLVSRLKLVGVASAGAQRGAALIGIDGQTPKPYRPAPCNWTCPCRANPDVLSPEFVQPIHFGLQSDAKRARVGAMINSAAVSPSLQRRKNKR